MTSPWQVRARTVAVLVLGVLTFGVPAASAQPAPSSPAPASTGTVTLRLGTDGSLAVTEQLDVPVGGTLERTVPLRTPAGDDRVRVLSVRDVRTDGPAAVTADDEALRVQAGPGTSTLEYTVDGALAASTDGSTELRWQVAGSGSATGAVTAVVQVPAAPLSVSCLAGAPDTATVCTAASSGSEQGGEITVRQNVLAAGEQLTAVVVLPGGAAVASARYEETFSLGRAFRPGAASITGLVVALLLGGGGALLLGARRGRDVRLRGAAAPHVVPLHTGSGGTTFASPDGVLPGQVGVVVDERVDPVDLTATVCDLAVRGYLHVDADTAGLVPTFRVRPAAPADDGLRPYEATVLAATTRSGGFDREARSRAHDELYDEVVTQGWFAHRPDAERGRWSVLGLAVTVVGVVGTVVLAALSTLALVGVGVALAGVAVLVAARVSPARTARGSALVASLGGLQDFLDAGDLSPVAPEHREQVLTRCLPYAVVLHRLPGWTAVMSGTDDTADGSPGWSWLTVDGGPGDAAQLTALTAAWCTSLDAGFTRAGHLRALR